LGALVTRAVNVIIERRQIRVGVDHHRDTGPRPVGVPAGDGLLIPEAKTVKNRMHLDLRIGTDDVSATVEKLTARGAKFLHNGQQGPHTWVTMADPWGNEFCVA
jgi:hypothetical protein